MIEMMISIFWHNNARRQYTHTHIFIAKSLSFLAIHSYTCKLPVPGHSKVLTPYFVSVDLSVDFGCYIHVT